MPNALAPPNQNALYGPTEDYGLPIRNRYGQYEVGGPLGGNEGRLDMLYEVMPVVGDARAMARAHEASQPTITPNLMGGATVGLEDPYTAAFETATALPAVGDAATLLKMGAASLPGLLAMMARRSDAIFAKGMAPQARHMQGLIGYHGSPHKFDKFSHSQMGTGEGAQAYGWGTYIAENPDVATGYSKQTTSWQFHDKNGGLVDIYDVLENPNIRSRLQDTNGDINAAIKRAEELQSSIPGTQGAELALRDAEKLKAIQESGGLIRPEANLYEVDIPDAKISQMLDWDAPLSEQPESVKAIYESLPFDSKLREQLEYGLIDQSKITGGQLYRGLGQEVTGFRSKVISDGGRGVNVSGDQAVSEWLSNATDGPGIPGIKYFDGNSRTAGEGTRNFVVFDEGDMTILSRNGEKIAQSADSLPMNRKEYVTR